MEDTSAASELKFSESDLTRDPFELFKIWLAHAEKYSGYNDPNAMCLSTVDRAGFPDSRMVLLKDYDENGFVFYTNSLSRKGKELTECPRAALNFFWDSVRRQIRIQGNVSRVSNEEANSYFSTRPRISQLGAWASLQSEVLDDRTTLENRLSDYEAKFPGEIPRPSHWLGYRVSPVRIEFWQDRRNRLHDRFAYVLEELEWRVCRLYP